MLRGIDSVEKLRAFFEAKGHRYLVLRIADVLELANRHQDTIIGIASGVRPGAVRRLVDVLSSHSPVGWRKDWLAREFSDGYIRLPIDHLLESLPDMQALVELQEALQSYMHVRREKGEPCRVETCPHCQGQGCRQCDGTGQIVTFVEMSDEEQLLAEGATA
jgi:hypothetical protein